MPRDLARVATLASVVDCNFTGGHATRCSISTTSLQAGQPALNTSTFRLAVISVARWVSDLLKILHPSER